jgi:E3 ubiquitin-protein ligase HUWE1
LDAALIRTVEQWHTGHSSSSNASATSPQAMEVSGSDSGTAPAGGGSSSSEAEPQKVAPPPLLHGLLPLLEAFFLAHAPEKKGSEQAGTTEAATPGGANDVVRRVSNMSLVEMSREEKAALEPKTAICALGEKHKKAINALVRQAPSLLSGGFAPLMEAAPWALDFDNKRHYLRQRLRALRGDSRYDVVRLHIRRNQVFQDSYQQLQMQSGEEIRGKLSVTFIGEEAMDAGGVAREWFKILAREIFNPNYALFSQAGGKACTFHPNKMSHWNPDHLRYFTFIGRVIGKALFDGHHLEAYFTRSFYKHMLRRKVNTSDMEAMDPDYYKNLQFMLENPVAGVFDYLRFTADTEEFGRHSVVELKPGGANIPVTDDNKREYVQLMCEHKMTKSVQPQITAFLEGFHELVPPSLISLFDDKELELLISGLPEIDIDDLRRNTDYHNYSEATPQIQWFWKVLGEFNKEQKAWFLQFVTGTSQVPLEGFKGLIGMRGPQKFSIHRAEGGDRLPTAHTCFNQLDLPEYSTEEQMRKKVIQAVHEAHEGFGFV